MATPIQTILQWWKQYAKPTETQVAETFNSLRHKNDSVPAAEVGGLDDLLLQKADKIPFEEHIGDKIKHITSLERESWSEKANAQDIPISWRKLNGTKPKTVNDDIYSNGKIGIKTSAPTAVFDVSGDARVRSIPHGLPSDSLLSVDTNGNFRKVSQPSPSSGMSKSYSYTGSTYHKIQDRIKGVKLYRQKHRYKVIVCPLVVRGVNHELSIELLDYTYRVSKIGVWLSSSGNKYWVKGFNVTVKIGTHTPTGQPAIIIDRGAAFGYLTFMHFTRLVSFSFGKLQWDLDESNTQIISTNDITTDFTGVSAAGLITV